MSSRRVLFYDVTEISRLDRGTGIQRVIRETYAALQRLLCDLSLIPVVADILSGDFFPASYDDGFFRAGAKGEPIRPKAGDIFLSVDLNYKISEATIAVLRGYKQKGVSIHFVIYDILPLTRPQYFNFKDGWFDDEDFILQFTLWLKAACELSQSLICISAATMRDVASWIAESEGVRRPILKTFRLGTGHIPEPEKASEQVAGIFDGSPVFVMVGTVEPRKAHALALKAFDLLWGQGHRLKLVIVGKCGWASETVVSSMTQHRLFGSSLHFLENLPDNELAHVYREADALLSLSEAEGFGMPNIEAAVVGLPIIARDIPVFREVCGNGAYYLKNDISDAELAQEVLVWLERRREGAIPTSDQVELPTWDQSAKSLLSALELQGALTHP